MNRITRAGSSTQVLGRTVRKQRTDGMNQVQELNGQIFTFCYFSRLVNKRCPEFVIELSLSCTLVRWQHVFSWITHIIDRMVVAWPWHSCTWFVESLRWRWIPYFRSWTFVFAHMVFSICVEFVIKFISTWTRVDPYCCLLELVVKGCPFRVVDGSHCPFGSFIVPELIISSRPREFYTI